MKKIFSISLIAAFTCFMFANVQVSAQKSKAFAGTVKFHVKYEGDTDPQKHVPQDYMVTIFGNKMKQLYYEGQLIAISDCNALTTIVLYNIPGYQIGYIDTAEKYDSETSNTKLTFTEGTDTKTICGYVCKRYDVTIYDKEEDEETALIVYTTTEIGENNNINAMSLSGLTGYPLYMEVESDGIKRITEATEVKATKIKAVDFMIPSSYKIMSQEEVYETLQTLMGGGGE